MTSVRQNHHMAEAGLKRLEGEEAGVEFGLAR